MNMDGYGWAVHEVHGRPSGSGRESAGGAPAEVVWANSEELAWV